MVSKQEYSIKESNDDLLKNNKNNTHTQDNKYPNPSTNIIPIFNSNSINNNNCEDKVIISHRTQLSNTSKNSNTVIHSIINKLANKEENKISNNNNNNNNNNEKYHIPFKSNLRRNTVNNNNNFNNKSNDDFKFSCFNKNPTLTKQTITFNTTNSFHDNNNNSNINKCNYHSNIKRNSLVVYFDKQQSHISELNSISSNKRKSLIESNLKSNKIRMSIINEDSGKLNINLNRNNNNTNNNISGKKSKNEDRSSNSKNKKNSNSNNLFNMISDFNSNFVKRNSTIKDLNAYNRKASQKSFKSNTNNTNNNSNSNNNSNNNNTNINTNDITNYKFHRNNLRNNNNTNKRTILGYSLRYFQQCSEEERLNMITTILNKPHRNLEELEILSQYIQEMKNTFFLQTKKKIKNNKSKNSSNKEKERERERILSLGANMFFEKVDKFRILLRYSQKGDNFYFILKGSVAVLGLKEEQVLLTEDEYYDYLRLLLSHLEYGMFTKTIESNFNIFPLEEVVKRIELANTIANLKKNSLCDELINNVIKKSGKNQNKNKHGDNDIKNRHNMNNEDNKDNKNYNDDKDFYKSEAELLKEKLIEDSNNVRKHDIIDDNIKKKKQVKIRYLLDNLKDNRKESRDKRGISSNDVNKDDCDYHSINSIKNTKSYFDNDTLKEKLDKVVNQPPKIHFSFKGKMNTTDKAREREREVYNKNNRKKNNIDENNNNIILSTINTRNIRKITIKRNYINKSNNKQFLIGNCNNMRSKYSNNSIINNCGSRKSFKRGKNIDKLIDEISLSEDFKDSKDSEASKTNKSRSISNNSSNNYTMSNFSFNNNKNNRSGSGSNNKDENQDNKNIDNEIKESELELNNQSNNILSNNSNSNNSKTAILVNSLESIKKRKSTITFNINKDNESSNREKANKNKAIGDKMKIQHYNSSLTSSILKKYKSKNNNNLNINNNKNYNLNNSSLSATNRSNNINANNNTGNSKHSKITNLKNNNNINQQKQVLSGNLKSSDNNNSNANNKNVNIINRLNSSKRSNINISSKNSSSKYLSKLKAGIKGYYSSLILHTNTYTKFLNSVTPLDLLQAITIKNIVPEEQLQRREVFFGDKIRKLSHGIINNKDSNNNNSSHNNYNLIINNKDDFPYIPVTVFSYYIVGIHKKGENFGYLVLEAKYQQSPYTIISLEETHLACLNSYFYKEIIRDNKTLYVNDNINMLLNTPVFSDFGLLEIKKNLYKHFEIKNLNIHDVLFTQGSECEFVYFILEGEVELSVKLSCEMIETYISNLDMEYIKRFDWLELSDNPQLKAFLQELVFSFFVKIASVGSVLGLIDSVYTNIDFLNNDISLVKNFFSEVNSNKQLSFFNKCSRNEKSLVNYYKNRFSSYLLYEYCSRISKSENDGYNKSYNNTEIKDRSKYDQSLNLKKIKNTNTTYNDENYISNKTKDINSNINKNNDINESDKTLSPPKMRLKTNILNSISFLTDNEEGLSPRDLKTLGFKIIEKDTEHHNSSNTNNINNINKADTDDTTTKLLFTATVKSNECKVLRINKSIFYEFRKFNKNYLNNIKRFEHQMLIALLERLKNVFNLQVDDYVKIINDRKSVTVDKNISKKYYKTNYDAWIIKAQNNMINGSFSKDIKKELLMNNNNTYNNNTFTAKYYDIESTSREHYDVLDFNFKRDIKLKNNNSLERRVNNKTSDIHDYIRNQSKNSVIKPSNSNNNNNTISNKLNIDINTKINNNRLNNQSLSQNHNSNKFFFHSNILSLYELRNPLEIKQENFKRNEKAYLISKENNINSLENNICLENNIKSNTIIGFTYACLRRNDKDIKSNDLNTTKTKIDNFSNSKNKNRSVFRFNSVISDDRSLIKNKNNNISKSINRGSVVSIITEDNSIITKNHDNDENVDDRRRMKMKTVIGGKASSIDTTNKKEYISGAYNLDNFICLYDRINSKNNEDINNDNEEHDETSGINDLNINNNAKNKSSNVLIEVNEINKNKYDVDHEVGLKNNIYSKVTRKSATEDLNCLKRELNINNMFFSLLNKDNNKDKESAFSQNINLNNNYNYNNIMENYDNDNLLDYKNKENIEDVDLLVNAVVSDYDVFETNKQLYFEKKKMSLLSKNVSSKAVVNNTILEDTYKKNNWLIDNNTNKKKIKISNNRENCENDSNSNVYKEHKSDDIYEDNDKTKFKLHLIPVETKENNDRISNEVIENTNNLQTSLLKLPSFPSLVRIDSRNNFNTINVTTNTQESHLNTNNFIYNNNKKARIKTNYKTSLDCNMTNTNTNTNYDSKITLPNISLNGKLNSISKKNIHNINISSLCSDYKFKFHQDNHFNSKESNLISNNTKKSSHINSIYFSLLKSHINQNNNHSNNFIYNKDLNNYQTLKTIDTLDTFSSYHTVNTHHTTSNTARTGNAMKVTESVQLNHNINYIHDTNTKDNLVRKNKKLDNYKLITQNLKKLSSKEIEKLKYIKEKTKK